MEAIRTLKERKELFFGESRLRDNREQSAALDLIVPGHRNDRCLPGEVDVAAPLPCHGEPCAPQRLDYVTPGQDRKLA